MHSVYEQVGRRDENYEKQSRRNTRSKATTSNMKNSFKELISMLDMAEEEIS